VNVETITLLGKETKHIRLVESSLEIHGFVIFA
jgi:hypothetical protein